jgi:hypothetical protein
MSINLKMAMETDRDTDTDPDTDADMKTDIGSTRYKFQNQRFRALNRFFKALSGKNH